MAETADVVMVKTGDTLVPAATVTEAGTVALGSLLDKFTTVSTGAMPLMVTLFAVVERLPVTDVGDNVTESTFNGLTVSTAVLVAPEYLADIVAGVAAGTALVATAKVVPSDPSAMDTVAGTDAALVLLERLIVTPPVGALSLRLTYPVAPLPPITEVGEVATPASNACGTSVLVSVEVPKVAVIYKGESASTGFVVIGNETVV